MSAFHLVLAVSAGFFLGWITCALAAVSKRAPEPEDRFWERDSITLSPDDFVSVQGGH